MSGVMEPECSEERMVENGPLVFVEVRDFSHLTFIYIFFFTKLSTLILFTLVSIINHYKIKWSNIKIKCIFFILQLPLNPIVQATKREIPSKDIIAIALNGIPVYGPMASMGMGIVELEKLVTNSAELEPPDLDDKHTAALQGGRGGGGQYWYGKLM